MQRDRARPRSARAPLERRRRARYLRPRVDQEAPRFVARGGEHRRAPARRRRLVRGYSQRSRIDALAGTSARARRTRSGRAGSASGARALELVGHELHRACARPPPASSPGASPVRFATRKMCVSTAIVGCPNATFSTTFAVLRPTPGSVSSASRSAGTLPPCSRSRISRQRDDVLRLVAEEADRLDVRDQAVDAELRRSPPACWRPGRASRSPC